MTLQDLGSIGELIGAVASVAMLGYLAVHVRQNTTQLRKTTSVATTTSSDRTIEAFSRVRHLLAQPGNAEVYVRGLESYAALDEPDRLRLNIIPQEQFVAFRGMYMRTIQKTYEQSTGEAQATSAASILDTPGGAEWWVENRAIFDDEYATEIGKFTEHTRTV